jgi:hypothetical protein
VLWGGRCRCIAPVCSTRSSGVSFEMIISSFRCSTRTKRFRPTSTFLYNHKPPPTDNPPNPSQTLSLQLYDLYSFEVIPRVGQAVTGDREAYQYLVESIRKFPRQEDLVSEMTAAGFARVSHTNFTLGAVAVHSGFKVV